MSSGRPSRPLGFGAYSATMPASPAARSSGLGRRVGPSPAAAPAFLEHPVHRRGDDHPRTHAVGGHPGPGEVPGQARGHVHHGRLGRGVRHHVGERRAHGPAADGDHPAPAVRAQRGQQRLADPHRRQHIALEGGPPVGRSGALPVVLGERTGVVDQDAGPEVACGESDLLGDARLRQIAEHHFGPYPARRDLLGDGRRGPRVPPVDEDLAPLVRQRLGDRRADPRTAARHQRAVSCQP